MGKIITASSPVVAATVTPASGLGICLPYRNFAPSAAESLTTVGAANTQQECQFISDYDITLGHVTLSIGTPLAGSLFGIALYNAAGLVKLAAADGFSTAAPTNAALRVALNASITLVKGTAYWLAWTSTTAATLTIQNFLQSVPWQNTYNAGAIRSGNSGTATAGGVTNANIGVVTSAQLRIPLFIFD